MRVFCSCAAKVIGPIPLVRHMSGYAAQAEEVIPANVVMLSGCKDVQTSADVHDTTSFGLKPGTGACGAGGACTCSMIKALQSLPQPSWVELLQEMRKILKSGSYSQIPQLSCSRQMTMTSPFDVLNPQPNGNRRAVLVGINYVGSSCQLSGCHNDVKTMLNYLRTQGFQDSSTQVLLDDGSCQAPTKEAMVSAMRWLVDGAGPGDSLFFHYSGHGASVEDNDGDEADGMDEALCPVDYERAGFLRDDEVFVHLVKPLGEGVQLTCVMDCCHSGTIMDLPYMFRADVNSLDAVANGQCQMQENERWDAARFMQAGMDFAVQHPELILALFSMICSCCTSRDTEEQWDDEEQSETSA